MDLKGKAVAITGGGRGIGRKTAEEFVRRGAVVAIGDLDGEAASEAAADIDGETAGYQLDVSSRDSFATFLEHARAVHGELEILVNNAGIMPLGSFLAEDDETSRRTIEVNLWGPILGMRLALPAMVERGHGHVINVASMMGKLHVPGAAVYGASKYATVGLGAAVRDELHGTGVAVTTVLPSAVKTDLVAGVPLGRGLPTVEPEQVAKAIVDCTRKRPAEVLVPGWMAAYEPAVAIAPNALVGALRRLVGHDRVLTDLDLEQRAAYDERIRRRG